MFATKTEPALPGASHRDRSAERHEMRQLFLISYPLCLIAVIGRRLLRHFSGHSEKSDQSVFAEARSSAYAAVGYAFNA